MSQFKPSRIYISAAAAAVLFAAAFISAGCKGKDSKQFSMAMNVVGYKADVQPIEETISLIGTMAANESVQIRSEIDGVIESINFEEGQPVTGSQVLFQIDQRKLNARLAQAQAELKMADASKKRYEQLEKSKAVSGQEVDQAVATYEINAATVDLYREELEDATVRAPFDGFMGARMVSLGQFVTKGSALTSIVDLDPMKTEFNVPERYLGMVEKGQSVTMKVAAYPDESFTGKVYFISPQIDELTRTALVKALIPNPEGKLKSGMFATLNLIVSIREETVVIPETAILLEGDKTSVYTVNADNQVEIRFVKTGVRLAGKVEITEGVQAGETVVIEGTQKIRPGAKVNPRFEDKA
ncbi:MAG: efflux RND transporter periplasmic adaptor subunit [Candidatus Omnitrophica bacterium]|nr:efflux RND transporter periplasmic adaptor subunit [Candidatus Omnitrophota bacterium]